MKMIISIILIKKMSAARQETFNINENNDKLNIRVHKDAKQTLTDVKNKNMLLSTEHYDLVCTSVSNTNIIKQENLICTESSVELSETIKDNHVFNDEKTMDLTCSETLEEFSELRDDQYAAKYENHNIMSINKREKKDAETMTDISSCHLSESTSTSKESEHGMLTVKGYGSPYGSHRLFGNVKDTKTTSTFGSLYKISVIKSEECIINSKRSEKSNNDVLNVTDLL